jgi:hypothetical protein
MRLQSLTFLMGEASFMKNVFLCGLVMVGLPVLADDATTNSAPDTNAAAASAPAAAPAPPPVIPAGREIPGPSTNAASLAPVKGDPNSLPSSDERMEVMDINQQLRSTLHADKSPETWDAADARIAGLEKKFGKSPGTTGDVVLLRRIQLAVAKKSGVDGRFDALVTKLSSDPNPKVAAMAAAAAAAPKPAPGPDSASAPAAAPTPSQ